MWKAWDGPNYPAAAGGAPDIRRGRKRRPIQTNNMKPKKPMIETAYGCLSQSKSGATRPSQTSFASLIKALGRKPRRRLEHHVRSGSLIAARDDPLADAARCQDLHFGRVGGHGFQYLFPWPKLQSLKISGERLQLVFRQRSEEALRSLASRVKSISRASGGTLAILMMAVRSLSAKILSREARVRSFGAMRLCNSYSRRFRAGPRRAPSSRDRA